MLSNVLAASRSWAQAHPSLSSELWLSELYADKDDPLCRLKHGVTWDEALQFGLRRLTTPKNATKGPYFYGVSRFQCSDVHRRFWVKITSSFDLKYILTTNYDILIERALHDLLEDGRTQPQFYYGGFQYLQVVKKMRNLAGGTPDSVELGHRFALYKLHGSLNWAFEPHSLSMKIHDDVRAVFRVDKTRGRPAIVPPIPEKDMPLEFSHIWHEASRALEESETWIVCGYSMPPYDIALAGYFGRALQNSRVRRIVILDPNSHDLQGRWNMRDDVQIDCRPGLPDALEIDW